jgi:hypothetical protein
MYVRMYVCMYIAVLSLSQTNEPYLKEHKRCSVVMGCSTHTHTHTDTHSHAHVFLFSLCSHTHIYDQELRCSELLRSDYW